jgi:hypothetical protein
LTARLRSGGRITTDTLERIHNFMTAHPPQGPRPIVIERAREPRLTNSPALAPVMAPSKPGDPQRNFRFFDNRQKYLLFVNTCSEKWEVASRVAGELALIHPRPPAVRVFDAGVGDGSVLVRTMRAMHDRFTHMPFYVVGKEISLEDAADAAEDGGPLLRASGDGAHPHQSAYADAPCSAVKSLNAASSLVWHELPLTGIPPTVSSSRSSTLSRSSRSTGKPG